MRPFVRVLIIAGVLAVAAGVGTLLLFGTVPGVVVLAAGLVLALLVESGKKASQLLRVFEPEPQILKNYRYTAGTQPLETDPVKTAIAEAETQLGTKGRLLVRKSGTEPVIRVMAEGDRKLITKSVDRIIDALRQADAS